MIFQTFKEHSRNFCWSFSRMVKFLIANANSLDLNCQDNYGNTPLHAACEDGSVNVAKTLIVAGANQYIENREEKKPLEVAKPEVARAILERWTLSHFDYALFPE